MAQHANSAVALDATATASDILDQTHTPIWQRLRHGMTVRFRDDAIGTIEHLWFDRLHSENGEMMVRLAAPPAGVILVSLDHVRLIDDLSVSVDVDSTPIELLTAHAAP